MSVSPDSSALPPAGRVNYTVHLMRSARTDAWDWIQRDWLSVGVTGAGIFIGVAVLFGTIFSEAGVPASICLGILAVMIAGAGIYAAHLFYYTPRKLCAAKQSQLDDERQQFALEREKEKQATQALQEELDTLKSTLQEQPLPAPALGEEIDKLLGEVKVVLKSRAEALTRAAELWLEDVERFCLSHLSPAQAETLQSTSPPDLEEKVRLSLKATKRSPITQEERAVAEHVLKINAGLREVRKEFP